jgi:plasmid maintenance system antidote protein VapI
MKKMTKKKFSKARRISESLFCTAVNGSRNLGKNNAIKVARALGTDRCIWMENGFSMARTAAWVAYQDKHNNGGKEHA